MADHVGDRGTIDQHPGRAHEVFRCHGQRQRGVSDETEPRVSLCGMAVLRAIALTRIIPTNAATQIRPTTHSSTFLNIRHSNIQIPHAVLKAC